MTNRYAAIQGKHAQIMARKFSDKDKPGAKVLLGVIEIDAEGGHRHYFQVTENGSCVLTTESLAAAIRRFDVPSTV